jgi:hypothetical protein
MILSSGENPNSASATIRGKGWSISFDPPEGIMVWKQHPVSADVAKQIFSLPRQLEWFEHSVELLIIRKPGGLRTSIMATPGSPKIVIVSWE